MAELENEDRLLAQRLQDDDSEHSQIVLQRRQFQALQTDLAQAEARAAAAEAEVNRLTALLRRAATAA